MIDKFTGEKCEIFKDYVNAYLKIKMENSGLPPGCNTDLDLNSYIKDYYKNEGIVLNKENIQTNSARRSVAKMMLVSLFGKLAQKCHRKNTKFVTSENPSELIDLLSDPKIEIKDFNIVSSEIISIEYTDIKEFLSSPSVSNVVIAAFITSYGRMKLYEILDQVQRRAFYCDTDSIIYEKPDDSDGLPVGRYLGELTSEIPENTEIVEFVSTGPKIYSYMLSNGEKILKYKGFSLNSKASVSMNFSAMKQMLNFKAKNTESHDTDENDGTVQISTSMISRNRKMLTINSFFSKIKTYKFTVDKRIVSSDYVTMPFGY